LFVKTLETLKITIKAFWWCCFDTHWCDKMVELNHEVEKWEGHTMGVYIVSVLRQASVLLIWQIRR